MDRVKEIDFIKCIAMVMIVSGHAGVSVIRGLAPVHVGLFFVCSGFLLNEKLGMRELVCRNIKRLYVPFVGFSIVFIVLHNIFQPEGWQYSVAQHYYLVLEHSFLMDVTEPLLGPMWYLTALFCATMMWGGVKWIKRIVDPEGSLSPIGLDIFLYVILLLISINLTNNGKKLDVSFMNPQIINVSLAVPFLLELGHRYRRLYGALEKNRRYIMSGIISYCCLRVTLGAKPLIADVRSNNWGDLFEYMMALILVWHFLFVLGTYITRSKFLYKIFGLVSKNTLWIMALHMLSLEIFKKTISSKGFIVGYIKVAWAMILPILVHWIYSMLTQKIITLKKAKIKETTKENLNAL